MTKAIHGVVRGKTIEIAEDLSGGVALSKSGATAVAAVLRRRWRLVIESNVSARRRHLLL